MRPQPIRPSALYQGVPYEYAAIAPDSRLVFTAGACPLDPQGCVVAGERSELVRVWNVIEEGLGAARPPSTLLGVSLLGYPEQRSKQSPSPAQPPRCRSRAWAVNRESRHDPPHPSQSGQRPSAAGSDSRMQADRASRLSCPPPCVARRRAAFEPSASPPRSPPRSPPLEAAPSSSRPRPRTRRSRRTSARAASTRPRSCRSRGTDKPRSRPRRAPRHTVSPSVRVLHPTVLGVEPCSSPTCSPRRVERSPEHNSQRSRRSPNSGLSPFCWFIA